MWCLVTGPMCKLGFIGGGDPLDLRLHWISSSYAYLFVRHRREIAHNFFTLQSLLGELAASGYINADEECTGVCTQHCLVESLFWWRQTAASGACNKTLPVAPPLFDLQACCW